MPTGSVVLLIHKGCGPHIRCECTTLPMDIIIHHILEASQILKGLKIRSPTLQKEKKKTSKPCCDALE